MFEIERQVENATNTANDAGWWERVVPVTESLARRVGGMTGADIEQLVRQARRKARREKRQLSYADLSNLLDSVRPPLSDEASFRIAHHEAGHVVVGLHLEPRMMIRQVVLNDRDGNGLVAGSHPQDELLTEERMMARITTCLAGRAAERLFCGNASAHSGCGKQSDLAQATKLAYLLEMASGLGCQHPLVYREVEDLFALLANNTPLVEMINARLSVNEKEAWTLVVRHQKAIEYLAGCLFVWGTLDGSRLDEVLAEVINIMKAREDLDVGF